MSRAAVVVERARVRSVHPVNADRGFFRYVSGRVNPAFRYPYLGRCIMYRRTDRDDNAVIRGTVGVERVRSGPLKKKHPPRGIRVRTTRRTYVTHVIRGATPKRRGVDGDTGGSMKPFPPIPVVDPVTSLRCPGT